MIIPNLIIPGAAKSGTSSLHQYLNLHPDILMSIRKEPHFFTLSYVNNIGLDYYNDIFPEKDKIYKYYGESSTSYLPNIDAHIKIKNTLRDIRLIVILRNPVHRTISHYKWLVALEQERKPFRKAILENYRNGTGFEKPDIKGNWRSYYFSSLYGEQMHHLYNTFPKEEILVITTECLAEDPLNTLNQCFVFLGLDKLPEIPLINKNSTSEKLIQKKKNLQSLKNIYNLPVKRILEIFGHKMAYLFSNKQKLMNSIKAEDKAWLLNLLKDDIKLFQTYHPEIVQKWEL